MDGEHNLVHIVLVLTRTTDHTSTVTADCDVCSGRGGGYCSSAVHLLEAQHVVKIIPFLRYRQLLGYDGACRGKNRVRWLAFVPSPVSILPFPRPLQFSSAVRRATYLWARRPLLVLWPVLLLLRWRTRTRTLVWGRAAGSRVAVKQARDGGGRQRGRPRRAGGRTRAVPVVVCVRPSPSHFSMVVARVRWSPASQKQRGAGISMSRAPFVTNYQ